LHGTLFARFRSPEDAVDVEKHARSRSALRGTARAVFYYKLAIPMLAMLGQDFAKGYGPEGGTMAQNTEWFEALTTEEAKQERFIIGMWVGRIVALVAVLCMVAYATQS
jgi:hypothetical protein